MTTRPLFPKAVRTEATAFSGLTLEVITTKAYTFTIEQLKRVCTADKLYGMPYDREQVKDLIKDLARLHRYTIFKSFAPYRITFNGYGQLKSMQLMEDGSPVLKVDEIFNRLAKDIA